MMIGDDIVPRPPPTSNVRTFERSNIGKLSNVAKLSNIGEPSNFADLSKIPQHLNVVRHAP